MWSPIDGFSPHQRERVNYMLDQTYHAFITNVSEARKIPIEKMADIAKGRVWTGDQAIKIGLVDELGGYDAALKEIRNTLKLLETDTVILDEFPAPVSPAEKILKLFKGVGIESAMISNILARFQQMNVVLTHVLDYVTVFETPSAVSMPRPLLKVTQ